MTTPNEELILKLRGQAYTTCRPDQLCDQAADLLQSQAERIKELELDLDVQAGSIEAVQAANSRLAAERDTLRAELKAIAATEPVAYRWVWKSKPWDIEGWCYTNTPPTLPELQEIEPLFTRPMPAESKDAERYRWLRDYLISPSTHFDDLIVSADKADTLDGVIDAARAKGTK